MFRDKQSPILDEVMRVTRAYLGPAAESLISKQIENHLHKRPEQLTRHDLHDLIDWIIAVASLTNEDAEVVEEYMQALQNLAEPPETRALNHK